MGWRKWALASETWFLVGFVFSIVIIGINQNPFNPGMIPVKANRPLRLDFGNQKVRVIGWESDHAAVSVEEFRTGATQAQIRKLSFSVIKAQKGSIGLKTIKMFHGFLINTWFPISKEFRDQTAASNFLENNGLNIYEVKVPRHQPVIVRGKVLKTSGCRVRQESR